MRFRKLVKRVVLCALVICAAPILSSWAMGGLIPYTDVNVGNLLFSDIQETTTDPGVVKFGQPTGGDSFQFPAYVLNSYSVGGVGGGENNSSFSMTISSTTDYINRLDFVEGGNFFLSSFGGTTPTAAASIESTGSHLEILAVNGVNLVTPITVNPLSGDFSNPFNLAGPGTQSGDWSGSLSFNLTGQNVTKVALVLNNIANTGSSSTALAFIGGTEKAASMNVVTVPEPSSLILLGMGALVFVFTWKRKGIFR